MGEDTKGNKLPWRRRIMDYLEFAGVLAAIFLSLTGFLWLGFRNEVQSQAQEFLGVAELYERSDRAVVQIEALAETIQKLVPPPRVAEYDPLRTRIASPCGIWAECEYTVRARRTHDGEACAAPTVEGRIVVDRYGLQHVADAGAGARRPGRIDGEWRSVTASFLVPPEAPSGVAEYFLRLSYDCPWGTTIEETPRMVFEITKEANYGP